MTMLYIIVFRLILLLNSYFCGRPISNGLYICVNLPSFRVLFDTMLEITLSSFTDKPWECIIYWGHHYNKMTVCQMEPSFLIARLFFCQTTVL